MTDGNSAYLLKHRKAKIRHSFFLSNRTINKLILFKNYDTSDKKRPQSY